MVVNNAEEWAKQLWEKASESWMTRIQDNQYREYLVRPALENELSDIFIDNGILVDIGCGEGRETSFLRDFLVGKGFNTFYGFDTNKEFINSAKGQHKGIIFDAGSFSKLKTKYSLEERADLITSLFVLQDTPRVENIIKDVHNSLKKQRIFLSLIVHPQYAEILLGKGNLKINDQLEKSKNDDYVFGGEYPITEPGKPPFYVPYFHRNLSDYIEIFERHFHIETIRGLKPSGMLLEKAKKEKISPFYEEEHNVYWKEISEVPSSLIIKGIKK